MSHGPVWRCPTCLETAPPERSLPSWGRAGRPRPSLAPVGRPGPRQPARAGFGGEGTSSCLQPGEGGWGGEITTFDGEIRAAAGPSRVRGRYAAPAAAQAWRNTFRLRFRKALPAPLPLPREAPAKCVQGARGAPSTATQPGPCSCSCSSPCPCPCSPCCSSQDGPSWGLLRRGVRKLPRVSHRCPWLQARLVLVVEEPWPSHPAEGLEQSSWSASWRPCAVERMVWGARGLRPCPLGAAGSGAPWLLSLLRPSLPSSSSPALVLISSLCKDGCR